MKSTATKVHQRLTHIKSLKQGHKQNFDVSLIVVIRKPGKNSFWKDNEKPISSEIFRSFHTVLAATTRVTMKSNFV